LSLPLFLVDHLPDGDRYLLTGAEGHHAATVQRLGVGAELLLGDGRGGLASATVAAAGRGVLDLAVSSRRFVPAPSPRVAVAQALAKGDRGELAVQAMTEVGVDAIVPWSAARCVARWRDDKPLHRWRATVREAVKQSRRAWVPEVAPVASTADVAARPGLLLVLHESADRRLSTVDLSAAGDVTVVVGPEGGVAPEELAAFEAAGGVVVRLGAEVVRTSTAGVAALAALSVRLGRW
jgi:16S rRNA (uracil1498-N3)-methyltransferase